MKNFLVTTPIKESYGPSSKNVFLGAWCFDNVKDIKKNKIINYHWSNKKKFKEDGLYIDRMAEKLCRFLSKQLNKIHNLTEAPEYWKLLIYPWTHHYVATVYDRWESIKIFLKHNKNKVIYSYELDINETNFTPINHADFIENTYKDVWNYLIFLRILKFYKLKNIKFIKKKFKYSNNIQDNFFPKEERNFFDYLILLYEKIFSKFAFKFNKVIIESFSFPKKKFFEIFFKNLLFPSFYQILFKDEGSKKDLNFEKRVSDLNKTKEKNNDKFYEFLIQNLINDLPMSYFENFLKSKKKMSLLANEKKVLISMRSWIFNDQFKICAAELVKKKSKYFTSEHGGGLMGEFNHPKNYTGHVANHICYNIDSVYKKKSYRLSPTINVIYKKNIDTYNNKKLNITFFEGQKYSHKFVPSPKAEEGINQITELLKFIELLPPHIKKKVNLRTKIPQLNIKNRFIEKFGKEKFQDSLKCDYFSFAKSSKLMIVNYPQTAYSSCMYYNVPTILVIDNKFWMLKKNSLKMFKLLKKNKMAFEKFEDANKYIVENWNNIYLWWNNKQTQKIRKLYLKNFFNIKEDWFDEWSKFIFNQKKI